MSMHIITDSACDITQAEAEELGITVIPLKSIFGTVEYLDGVDIHTDDFYEKLEAFDGLPSTSQASPLQFEEAFRSALETHDEVLCLCLSAKLSGTFQSAYIAQNALEPELQQRVKLVDTTNVTLGEQVLVRLALKLKGEGLSADHIADVIDDRKHHVRVLGLLDTLEYLKRGGRISPAVAAVGGLLSIKPVITVAEGELEMIGKARGIKNGKSIMNKHVGKWGIDYDLPMVFAYSGTSDAEVLNYRAENNELFESCGSNVSVCAVGPVIGTHVGPGAVAVAFFDKQ